MILFLDIDGVMVPAKGYKLPEMLGDGFPAFSRNATAALNTLLHKYNAEIKLTTSHKSRYTIEEWKQLFANRGILVDKLDSLPENSDKLSRKDEMVRWFNLNDAPASFVILDDDKSLNALPEYLKAYLVLTSSYIGLTEEHLNRIAEIMLLEEAV